MRAITTSNYLAHSAPLFSDLKILDIFKINALQTAKFMFSYYHQNLPSVFSNLFIISDQVHGYNTRNSSCSVIVRVSVVLKRTVGDSD